MPSLHLCSFCGKSYTTLDRIRRHLAHAVACWAEYWKWVVNNSLQRKVSASNEVLNQQNGPLPMEIDSDLFNPSNMVPDSTEPIRAEPVTMEDEVTESERDGTFWAEL